MEASRDKNKEREKHFASFAIRSAPWLRRARVIISWKLRHLRAEIRRGIKQRPKEPFEVRFRRVNLLTKNLIALAKETIKQEITERYRVQIAAKVASAHDERRKRRDRLIEVGMEAYEELRKLSSSEEAAKEAEYRMRAYLAMTRGGAFNAAVIRDQEVEDLSDLIMQVEEKNEQMEEELEKIRKKREQMDQDAH